MILCSNLSKMKNKILPSYLKDDYRESLGEFSSSSFGVFGAERVVLFQIRIHYWQEITDVIFRTINFRTLFTSLRTNFGQSFGLFAEGGLEIHVISKATFRIEQSKRLNILLRQKKLIQKNYELDLNQVQIPSSNYYLIVGN